jgi:hypothetical protein
MRKTRSAFLWLSITALFGLSLRSVALYARSPTFEKTIDFIALKLSGVSVSSQVECDKIQACGGSINTAWETRVTPSLSSCSVEVIQTVKVTKTQNAMCVWTGDVIGGRLWNHVTYQREYRFRLDLGSIARDGITVERATQENPRCVFIKSDLQYPLVQSDLPHSVHLTFTRGLNVIFRLKAAGSGNGEETATEEKGKATWNNDSFEVGSEQTAQRLARAFKHAADLCESKKEVF